MRTTIALTAIVVLTRAPQATAEQMYKIVDIPTVPGALDYSVDINNALDGVGLFTHSRDCCGVYTWDASGVRIWPDVSDVWSVHINSAGAIGGVRYRYFAAYGSVSNPRAFLFNKGRYVETALPPQNPLLNDRPSAAKLTESGILHVGVFYQLVTGPGQIVNGGWTYGIYESRVYKIDDLNVHDIGEQGVVGGADRFGRPVLRWPDGRVLQPWATGTVTAVGAGDHFAGVSCCNAPYVLYVGRFNGPMTLVSMDDTQPFPNSVNRSGDVVGATGTIGGQYSGFVYRGGVLFDLNQLVRQPAPHIRSAQKVTDGGAILAVIEDGRRVLLVPDVPLTPPGDVQVDVTGSIVTLKWVASSGATDYVIEAGSGPSLSDLYNASVGLRTEFTTPAPRGRYYVRVRARRGSGESTVSTEVIVDVP